MCMASTSVYLNKNRILDAAQYQNVEEQKRKMPEY